MANFLEDLDLSRDPFNVLLVIDLLLLQDFHGNLYHTYRIIQADYKRVFTFSPVKICVPCFTWPNVPFPRGLPMKKIANISIYIFCILKVSNDDLRSLGGNCSN